MGMCLGRSMCKHAVPMGAGRGHWILEAGVTGGCELLTWVL